MSAAGRTVIVCGGRNYADWARVWKILEEEHTRDPIACVRQGGAGGADGFARRWARTNEVPHKTHPAAWDTHGKQAGPIRNAQMAQAGADLCIAFPGGKGTADMIRCAERAGIPVRRVT